VLGALAGTALVSFLPPRATRGYGVAVAFLAVILVRGLSPFQFAAASQAFSLIPFSGFLADQWQAGMLVLFEKTFFYATAVWLFRHCGMRLWLSAALVAAVLLGIEIAQMHLPGRTAEVTDPMLALIAAFILGRLERRPLS
jgi:hypothetical protein